MILDGLPADEAIELYVAFEKTPTRLDYDYRATPQAGRIELPIPIELGGTYYILAHAPQLQDPITYAISAEVADIILSGIIPRRRGNSAAGTVTLTGAGFDDRRLLRYAALVPRCPCQSVGLRVLRRSLLRQASLPHRDCLGLAHGWVCE